MSGSKRRDFLHRDLKSLQPDLYQSFLDASKLLAHRLDYEQYEAWERNVFEIASVGSFRHFQTAAEFVRASQLLVDQLRFAQLVHWAGLGRKLLRLSPAVSAAFYRASAEVLGPVQADEFELWVTAAQGISGEGHRLQDLTAQFLEVSPQLLRVASLTELVTFAELIAILGRQAPDAASECLVEADGLLARVERRERLALIRTAIAFARTNPKAARAMLVAAPGVLRRFAPRQRLVFLGIVERLAMEHADDALALFRHGGAALTQVDADAVPQILDWGAEVATAAPAAALAFLNNCPRLFPKLGIVQLEKWLRYGITTLARDHVAGCAYFRLDSKPAHRKLVELSHVCELDSVQPVLRLYAKGLTGRDLAVAATDELVSKGVGWTRGEQATSDGSNIFLPAEVREYASRDENFAHYKVLATHQAAHVEFGSYDFQASRPATLFENSRWHRGLPPGSPAVIAIGDLEAFFDLFEDRRLAKQIFIILEDGRVDRRVLAQYAGIRASYRQAQRQALHGRPAPFDLPLRLGCVELVLQRSLGAELDVHPKLLPLASAISELADRLWERGGTVEDTAEATLRLYDTLRRVPNVRVSALDLDGMPESDLEFTELLAALDSLGSTMEEMAQVGDVAFRGAMKPELVETLMKVRRENDAGKGTPITPEALRQLLEKNLDIELAGIGEGDVDVSSGLFVNNLLRERGKERPAKRRDSADRQGEPVTAQLGNGLDAVEILSFYYDEWDFRAGDYRPRWCRLSEQLVKQGELDFYRDTVRQNAPLVRQLRQQFELLRPELNRKLKRLEDGEEFELDALIEAMVERRSGHNPSTKLYWRRNKVQRDVAVAFLLDMSASTDEEIEEQKPIASDDRVRQRGKRIIDLEKESLVLLTQALQAIGDRYGIYGFSGYGRDDCEFYVVKEIAEDFGDQVKRRIDKIAPVRGTRMGVAIRHATAKLESENAKLRIMIMLSDGYPQDHDYYDTLPSERDYALNDTRMALIEAKRKNIVPFCLTVDKSGNDYLKTMCADISYEIVNDVRSLPRRLPALYRSLTT